MPPGKVLIVTGYEYNKKDWFKTTLEILQAFLYPTLKLIHRQLTTNLRPFQNNLMF